MLVGDVFVDGELESFDNEIAATSDADCEVEWENVLGKGSIVLLQDEDCADSSQCRWNSKGSEFGFVVWVFFEGN
jgi:hypothetical protein